MELARKDLSSRSQTVAPNPAPSGERPGSQANMPARRARALALGLTLSVGILTAHASIRSPDAEVVYRTAESIALRGSFAVPQDLELWHEFGLPEGVDGRRYSIFSPLQALAEAPLVFAAEHMVPADWVPSGWHVPGSHYYTADPMLWTGKEPAPETARGHLIRSLVSLLDVLVLVLIAGAAFDLGFLITGSVAAAWLAGVLLPLGTFLLCYTTALFSEPIGVLLTLWALRALIVTDPALGDSTRSTAPASLAAGLLMGLSVAAHISAVVALPFVGMYAAIRTRPRWKAGVLFSCGVAVPLLLLGAYNQIRFGSWWETGRGLQNGFGYGTFVTPGVGLLGLTVSWGKGLIWYSPLPLVALAFFRPAFRASPALATMALTGFLARLVFIASRSDWHGGFCLGPRYMLLALPFALVILLLSLRGRIGSWLHSAPARGTIATVSALLIAQQLYFASGEIFGFGQLMRRKGAAMIKAGGTPDLYFDWDLSPLRWLVSLTRGPLVYRWMFESTWLNWVVLTALVLGAFLFVTRRLLQAPTGSSGIQ